MQVSVWGGGDPTVHLWGREESEEKGAGERVASKDLSSGTVQLYQLSRWGGWEGLEGPCCAREGVRKGSRGMEGKDGGRLTSKERITTRTPIPALCVTAAYKHHPLPRKL